MPSTRQKLKWIPQFHFWAILKIVILGHLVNFSSAENQKTGQFVIKKAASGSALCATSAPDKTITARSKLDCYRSCTSEGRRCAIGANYRKKQKQCEMYSDHPTDFQVVPDCSFYQNIDTEPSLGNTSAVSCPDMAAASVPRISAENCHYPFTYNGRLYYGCAENVENVTSSCETHGCFALNYTKAVCAANLEFHAESVLVNLAIPTQGPVPAMSVFDWVVYQQRDVATGFNWNRTWLEYKNGFGNSTTEDFWLGRNDFWLGLERLYLLTTSANYRLRFEWQDQFTGLWFSIEYWLFYIDDEANGYMLHVDGYIQGDDGRAFVPGAVVNFMQKDILNWGFVHDGTKFSTFDVDNDHHPTHCGIEKGGGWWHTACFVISPTCFQALWLNEADWGWYFLQKSRMMIKLQ